MTETLLGVFIILCAINTGLMMYFGSRAPEAGKRLFFVGWYESYPNKTVIISAVLVGVVMLFGMIFGGRAWAKTVLIAVDLIFAAILFLDYGKNSLKRWLP